MNLHAEWLETDGLGGFASGTVSGIHTRRYHALLLAATAPPTGRCVLVNQVDVTVETAAGRYSLSSHKYAPDVVHPDGFHRIVSFDSDPWPRWTFRLEDGVTVEQHVVLAQGLPTVALFWKLVAPRAGVRLLVRPLLSGRDYHCLHRENPSFRFDAEQRGGATVWHPYADLPEIFASGNGEYRHEPDWFRNFVYDEESARGLDSREDLASPGTFHFDLSAGEAVLQFSAGEPARSAGRLRKDEFQRRKSFTNRLHRSAEAYLVARGKGKTIVAGYPWFTDWGRDTFIALRGLCLATGHAEEARDILLEWAGCVSEGMLPNRFCDHGEQPEYNSVDASLWFVVAVHDLLAVEKCAPRQRDKLLAAVDAIVAGYLAGTRYGIRMDSDGLLRAGAPGVQLTWMDAKVGDWVVTPRAGKPVEIQALWLNALRIAGREDLYRRGLESFRQRFWSESRGDLLDVVDPDDPALRPNQIFAVGGLPYPLLEGEPARRIVDNVERHLWTPMGLRTLAPSEPGYCGRYDGGVRDRDAAYHQGTVWPWLLGPFVEAWLRVRDFSKEAKQEARTRFLQPLSVHINEAGLGHISEIADGDPPHTPRGCPFQAWSLGEYLRLSALIRG
jgi:predicted glycogen debranching enzyme